MVIAGCVLKSKQRNDLSHNVRVPNLANKEYIKRHNRVCDRLHWDICRHFKINVCDEWYKHQPDTVTSCDSVTLLWDSQI